MLTPDYLSLASVRLKGREKWVGRTAGLTFIFIRVAGGQCVWRKGRQHVGPGDVLVLNAGSGAQLSPATTRSLVFSFFSVNDEHLFPLFGSKEIMLVRGINELFNGVTLYPASKALAARCHQLLRDVAQDMDLDHRGQLLRIAAARA